MPETEESGRLSGPVLSINIGERLLPVDHVLHDLETLKGQQQSLRAQINATGPDDDPEQCARVERQLASINAQVERLENPVKIRHGHMYHPTSN